LRPWSTLLVEIESSKLLNDDTARRSKKNPGYLKELSFHNCVADLRCFIPDPGPKIFPSRIRIRLFFCYHGFYIKRGSKNKNFNFSCSLCYQYQEQILIVKKSIIPDPDPGSRG
jgi:hypothetical protein